METAGCCFPLTALLHRKIKPLCGSGYRKTNRTDHQHSNRGLGKTWAKPAAGQGERVRSVLPCV